MRSSFRRREYALSHSNCWDRERAQSLVVTRFTQLSGVLRRRTAALTGDRKIR